jgi:nucleoside-diphosphate kinase
MFGIGGPKNTVHGSDSLQSYKRECGFWFGDGIEASKRPMKTTAVLNNCSLCLIKPHVVMNG